jgi:hypothetical protein
MLSGLDEALRRDYRITVVRNGRPLLRLPMGHHTLEAPLFLLDRHLGRLAPAVPQARGQAIRSVGCPVLHEG